MANLIASPPHRWRVLDEGAGPCILLLHGAGASAESWAGVMPLLASDFRVLAIDLPGQGETRLATRMRSGLNMMAEDISTLMTTLDAHPSYLVGHSAGAAIALRMAETTFQNTPVIGFNAALAEFPGLAAVLFPALANLLALSPGAGDLIALAASKRSSTERLLKTTGGPITEEMVTRYHRLITKAAHVKATLAMMAQWRIQPIRSALPNITARTRLVVGIEDTTVPPQTSRDAAKMLPNADMLERSDLGHLAHEQDPVWAAKVIQTFAGNQAAD
ncbi:MAG: alpha/beta fold hydrolase [Paracoccaceae bacterium]|jgi:magnesium chelatase accessory protein|nr:alpha/beta fold hydrolase [Paracoccaceae bacterium]